MSLLNAGITAFSLIVMPFTGQTNMNQMNMNQTNVNQTNIIDTVLREESSYEPHYMYAIAEGVNIRNAPNLESTILDQTLINTQFEVVGEYDGWSMITTQDGYAYISSQYLSDIPVSNRWNILLSKSEKDLLARIVMLESANQSDEGQQAVVEVIMNRIYSDKFPDTLYGVLSQKNQFSTWKNRNSKRAVPTEQVKQNIELVLNGGTNILPMDTVYFSRGGENSRVERIIGDHVFCNR